MNDLQGQNNTSGVVKNLMRERKLSMYALSLSLFFLLFSFFFLLLSLYCDVFKGRMETNENRHRSGGVGDPAR
jgi:hypothetical protein